MSENSQRQPSSDINTSVVALIGFVGAILVFAIIVLIQVLYYHAVQEFDARQMQAAPQEWSTVQAEQRARLNRSVPPTAERAGRLSIDDAMRLTVAQGSDAAQRLVEPPEAAPPETADGDTAQVPQTQAGDAADAPASQKKE